MSARYDSASQRTADAIDMHRMPALVPHQPAAISAGVRTACFEGMGTARWCGRQEGTVGGPLRMQPDTPLFALAASPHCYTL